MSIPLNSKKLWGNEAADDEEPSILDSYFVQQDRFAPFFDFETRLSIARARKGLGKSALLRQTAYQLNATSEALVIVCKGADLVAQRPIANLTPDEHIYDWQQRICMLINREIGSKIGLALTDDKITLVETAELAGFKKRNLVGALVDRLTGKLGPVQLSKLSATDHKAILRRIAGDSEQPVWIFIDDIDATFRRTDPESLRLSTFFSACRDLSRSFTGINIRTCVRSDVWASIRKIDESLDKCEQYMFDIEWSTRQTGKIIGERIKSFLSRTNQISLQDNVRPVWQEKLADGESPILGLVFDRSLNLGAQGGPPHRVVHVYSAGRPRWAAQLCRMAGQAATDVHAVTIKSGHIKSVLEQYGRLRLDDIAREHKHQCPQMIEMINAFSRQPKTYSTGELLQFVRHNILNKIAIHIDDVQVPNELTVANFLFRIGFITAAQGEKLAITYVRYEERPDLLMSVVNIDDGNRWDIHPVYHAPLHLR